MGMAYDERTRLEALRDHMETYGKGANYLLVGHGAGFAGCLSIVKEHLRLEPAFQAVSLLIILFGTGLLLGAAYWFFAMILKISVTQSIISQTKPRGSWAGKVKGVILQILLHVTLWGSMGLFVIAMLVIMYPFRDGIDLLGRWVTAPR
jgi:hypothetical protein